MTSKESKSSTKQRSRRSLRCTTSIILLNVLSCPTTAAFLVGPSLTRRTATASSRTTLASTVVAGSFANRTHSSVRDDGNPTPKNPALLDLNQGLNRWAELAGKAADAQGSIAAARTAEQLWTQSTTNDLISYNTVLKAWAKCSHRLVELRLGLGGSNKPSAPLDSSLVSSTSSSTTTSPDDNLNIYTPKGAVDHAQDLLMKPPSGIKPDTQSFNIVMDAWAKSRDASSAQYVEQLFQQVDKPDSLSYNALLDSYAYTTFRLDKVMQIWEDMKKVQKNANSNVKPSLRTVNSVLHAHSRQAQDQPERAIELARSAMEILRKLEEEDETPPDVMTYTEVMDCWSRVAKTKYASTLPQEQAEALLKRLEKLAQAASTAEERERLTPSIYTYTTLLKTWSRSPSYVEKCEAVLEQLFNASVANVDKVVPVPPVNAMACTAVMQAYGRSHDSLKAVKALRLLQRMRSSNITPTIHTYNTAIEVCCHTRGTTAEQSAALKIAFAIFKTMQLEKITPNQTTFASLLAAVAYLMPPSNERSTVAEAVWHKATAAGQVDSGVVRNLFKACDAEISRRLVPDPNRLPPAWSRHVM